MTALSTVAASRRLGVSAALWSSWESNSKPIAWHRVVEIDRAFQAKGAFRALVWATTTTEALQPRQAWTHNLAPGRRHAWAWLRVAGPTHRTARAVIRWGPAIVPVELCGPQGIVVTTPVTVPNPPVRVILDSPGWVDFGPGTIPGEIGLPSVSGVHRMRAGPDWAGWEFAERIGRLVGHAPGWKAEVIRYFGDSDFIADALDGRVERPRETLDLASIGAGAVEPAASAATVPPDGAALQCVREARKLSRPTAAAQVSAIMRTPVSENQLYRLENGSRPSVAMLRAGLDRVYGGDGHLCLEPLAGGGIDPGKENGVWTVAFPPWWVGPVWVRFLHPSNANAVGEVELHWHPWVKRIRVRAGQTVRLRQAVADSGPLTVRAPAGWEVRAGVGHDERAHGVNDHWWIDDERAARRHWIDFSAIYLQAFGRDRREAAQRAWDIATRRSLRRSR